LTSLLKILERRRRMKMRTTTTKRRRKRMNLIPLIQISLLTMTLIEMRRKETVIWTRAI